VNHEDHEDTKATKKTFFSIGALRRAGGEAISATGGVSGWRQQATRVTKNTFFSLGLFDVPVVRESAAGGVRY
jgi:hypothetical protein